MKIGIDLSVLQTGHRKRGVGSVAINFINHLSANDKNNNTFVFFYEDEIEDILEPLDLNGVSYEMRKMAITNTIKFRGKLDLFARFYNKLQTYIEFRTGDKRLTTENLSDVDSYLQFDQNQKLPKNADTMATVILYDLIPYVMESEYLWTYKTARLRGRTRRSSLKCEYKRRQYISKLVINCRRAKNLIAISAHTKSDFIKFANADIDKISVVHLGADSTEFTKISKVPHFESFQTSVWGSITRPIDIAEKPFLLFVGGADPRRQIAELAAAYNNLKARGYDISLVLAGDTMFGIDKTPNQSLHSYLMKNMSYASDIHFVGYITNDQRDWLYQNALAYVYPSLYEGFGLPIIEAMRYGTPVITYRNSSIAEISGDAVMYAATFSDIVNSTELLLDDIAIRKQYRIKGIKHACSFTWSKTSSTIVDVIS